MTDDFGLMEQLRAVGAAPCHHTENTTTAMSFVPGAEAADQTTVAADSLPGQLPIHDAMMARDVDPAGDWLRSKVNPGPPGNGLNEIEGRRSESLYQDDRFSPRHDGPMLPFSSSINPSIDQGLLGVLSFESDVRLAIPTQRFVDHWTSPRNQAPPPATNDRPLRRTDDFLHQLQLLCNLPGSDSNYNAGRPGSDDLGLTTDRDDSRGIEDDGKAAIDRQIELITQRALDHRAKQLADDCGICYEPIVKALEAPCGHPCCKKCMKKAIRRSGKCPWCRTQMRVGQLTRIRGG
ncbi:unnamed protein product [Zymoseptoria tritici ST99CH_1A5]|uniref:RING-type domain-containing protein n=1 Tax=Zymoseptoria tritici ST99CH_1A5 TaxID=1276529 RepID=A0A1Y6LPP8_ZYMTR|nr:unnamed protein product [Zymoseptoria tritici ST99CH_1A5]